MEIHNKDTNIKIKIEDISDYPITTIKELDIYCRLYLKLKGYLPETLVVNSNQYNDIESDFICSRYNHNFRGGLCTYLASIGIPRLSVLSSTEILFKELVKLTENYNNIEIKKD